MPDFEKLRKAKKQRASISGSIHSSGVSIQLPQFEKPQLPQLRSTEREILKLQNDRSYWHWIIEDAKKGVFPAATVGLVGIGAVAGENDTTKLILGLLGLYFGNEIDKSRNERKGAKSVQIIENAEAQIKAIDKRIAYLKNVDKQITSLKSTGVLREEERGIFKPIVKAEEYRNVKIPSLGFRGEWLYLLGDPAPGFLMLITGAPGQGKSTVAIKFSQYFQENHGKVIYLAAEQSKLNKPLQRLLREFSATFAVHTMPTGNVDQLAKDIAEYDLIVIDSVNHLRMSAEDLESLRAIYPEKSFVAVMQSTKDGNYKGSQEFLHNCDIRVDLERPYAKQTKSRFAPPAEIPVFQEV